MSAEKYDDTLLPFLALMRRELHANSSKGDRPGWLKMSTDTALLEIYWHTAKLSAAVKNNDGPAIIEHSADVANMAMMLLDVCGGIPTAQAAPAAGAVAGPSEILAKIDTLIASVNEAHHAKDAGWKQGCFDAADSAYAQIKDMLAATPTPPAQAADSVLEDAKLLHYACTEGGSNGLKWLAVYERWDGDGYFIDALRAAYKQDAARKQGANHD